MRILAAFLSMLLGWYWVAFGLLVWKVWDR